MNRKLILLAIIAFGIASVAACCRVRPAKAVTWIEGHITSDTTWAPIDTYRVIGDAYVDPGATLTIQPGVRVEFADGFSLTIEGSFNATGTPSEPIVFTSSRSLPAPGSWGPIEFRANMSEHFVLENSRVEYATYGVVISSPAEAVVRRNEFVNNSQSGVHIHGESNITIEDNTIILNKNGITSDQSTVSGIRITHNFVAQNQGDGILVQATGENFSRISDVNVSNNTVMNNTGNGINLASHAETGDLQYYKCYGYIEDIVVSENQAVSNGQNGIKIDAEGHCARFVEYVRYGYAYVKNVNLLNNTVSSNRENGIYVHSNGYGFYGESFGYIENSSVVSNTGTGNGKNGLQIWSEGETDGSYASGGGGAIANLTIAENVFSSNSEDGIQLYSKGHADQRSSTDVNTLTITQNSASYNGKHGIQILAESQGNRGGNASINRIVGSQNKALFNRENGILIEAQTREEVLIQEIQLEGDETSLNGENGILIAPTCTIFRVENIYLFEVAALLNNKSGLIFLHHPAALPYLAYYRGYVENVTLFHSVLSRNGEKGFSIEPDLVYFRDQRYIDGALREVTIHNDTFVGNDVGVFICPSVPSLQDHTADIRFNSFRSNNQGVNIVGEHNNTANYNDILSNGFGMNVTDGATVDAENNYWGSESGPRHYSLNPDGEGNPVNGNGTDLDFIPFLTSPTTPLSPPPTAILSIENSTVYMNEIVTFDASNSTDDNGIRYWSFDFGDGTHTGWIPQPVVTHGYATVGTYNATLLVVNKFGLVSQNSSLMHVQVNVIPELPLPYVLPLVILTTLLMAILRKKESSIFSIPRKEHFEATQVST